MGTQYSYGMSSFAESIIKFMYLAIVLIVGLICGIGSSIDSFYITVFIQSVSNIYDASTYLSGYKGWITAFNTISLIANLAALICSLLSFMSFGTGYEQKTTIICMCCILSIPVIIVCIQMILLFKNKKY